MYKCNTLQHSNIHLISNYLNSSYPIFGGCNSERDKERKRENKETRNQANEISDIERRHGKKIYWVMNSEEEEVLNGLF